MKSGKVLVGSIAGIIIGVVVLVSLGGEFNKLYASTVNKGDAGAENYFGNLMKQIAIADNGGVGDFLLWQKNMKDEKKEFFLIYFGDKYRFSTNNQRTFLATGRRNKLCVCYWDGKEGSCGACKDLNYPAKYKASKNGDWKAGSWAIATGEEVTIKKVGGEYEFVNIVKS